MKRFAYLFLMLFGLLLVTSCNDDDDKLEVDMEWKELNEKMFQEQSVKPGYETLKSQSNAGHILYKVIKEGDSKEPIYYTSKVRVHYKGTFVDGAVFDDHSFESSAPADFYVKEMVDGFATALQNMHPGDRWEIWIPWQMGYGAAGKAEGGLVIVKPCSTLIFDLEVLSVVEP